MPLSHNFSVVLGDMERAIGRSEREKENLVKKLALTALGDAQTLSPVDTGLFRASHDLTIGEPSKLTLRPPPSQRQPGDPPVAEFNSETAKRTDEALGRLGVPVKLDGLVIFLSNNLEYAQALEHGHSQQAPAGIYRIVREKAEQRWNRVVLGANDDG